MLNATQSDIFRELEKNVPPASVAEPLGPFITSGFGPDSLHFEGRHFELLSTLTSSIAGSALESGGRDRQDVESLVFTAIRIARVDGSTAAIAYVDAELSRPMEDWTVMQSIRGRFHDALVQIGRTTLVRSASELSPNSENAEHWIGRSHEMTYPLLVASVRALDHQSAVRVAEDIFDETLAVLTMASPGWGISRPERIVLGSSPSFGGGKFESYVPHTVDEHGWFGYGVRALERAARKEYSMRTDWEKRSLVAARWYRRALVDTWPSAVLANCMVALESLFVKETHGSKGDKIGDRVSTRFSYPSKTSDELRDWLADLYQGRNNVVHSGGHYLQDTEVEALRQLVYSAVQWASQFLDDVTLHEDGSTGAFLDIDQVLGT